MCEWIVLKLKDLEFDKRDFCIFDTKSVQIVKIPFPNKDKENINYYKKRRYS